ncbi:MAG: tRNA (adenosine(37)-N6)-dimethylallyltransferase MiaA [Bacteroidales bacterium OttesenSCG-928-I14]|jgi:tRNA dimethylallyltransferase|nr:tRNA (adenosine(37)-N6)-dimethylallyltransferase MiaA [Bacteroidales bacterium OttesenSCG-928-I14]
MKYGMNNLVLIVGATCVGKTEIAIRLAKHFQSPIISVDSRQFYKELLIGTAVPSATDLNQAKHYFVSNLSIFDYYNASQFEQEAIDLISHLHKKHQTVIACGGSMLYIDVLCQGMDIIPAIDQLVRTDIFSLYKKEGIDPICQQLKIHDPVYYSVVDLKNHKRVIHALEVCLTTGKPYSMFRCGNKKKRPFNIIKIGLFREPLDLYKRINIRIDKMIKNGFLEEAYKVYPYRFLNSLNTIGYKELFRFFDGEYTLNFAIEKIKQNTRIYSRKQMSWFRKDKKINWIYPSNSGEFVISKLLRIIP